MKFVELSKQGKNKGLYRAIVNDKDYELVSRYRWFYEKSRNNQHTFNHYAMTELRENGKKLRKLRMHSLILDHFGKGSVIDHVNGNGLDNRRSNLRICTTRENALNTRRNRHLNKHGVNKFHDRYQSKISMKNKQIHLGTFLTEAEAVAAYQAGQRIATALEAMR